MQVKICVVQPKTFRLAEEPRNVAEAIRRARTRAVAQAIT